MWERSRTELNDYYSKEQPRRTESHQGKDAGSPRTYIAPWRSRESSSSPVSARVLRCTRPSRSLSRASALQPHSFLPRPPISSRCSAGSHRARALVPRPHPSAAAAACAQACDFPPSILPRLLPLWRAGLAPKVCAAHPAKWRR